MTWTLSIEPFENRLETRTTAHPHGWPPLISVVGHRRHALPPSRFEAAEYLTVQPSPSNARALPLPLAFRLPSRPAPEGCVDDPYRHEAGPAKREPGCNPVRLAPIMRQTDDQPADASGVSGWPRSEGVTLGMRRILSESIFRDPSDCAAAADVLVRQDPEEEEEEEEEDEGKRREEEEDDDSKDDGYSE